MNKVMMEEKVTFRKNGRKYDLIRSRLGTHIAVLLGGGDVAAARFLRRENPGRVAHPTLQVRQLRLLLQSQAVAIRSFSSFSICTRPN